MIELEYTTALNICQEEILSDGQKISVSGQAGSKSVKFERFSDKRPDGTERPWREKKMGSLTLSEAFEQLGKAKKALRVGTCAETMFFTRESGRARLVKAFFCGDRMCPMCQWRRSLRMGHDVLRVANYLVEKRNSKYLLLTLTIRNCSADNLEGTIDEMMEAWNRFLGYVEVERAVKGWFRSLEVTHNLEEAGTDSEYHPHFHVLLAVSPKYFKGRDYIKQSRIKELWQRAAKLDYEPYVYIQTVKGDLSKAVLESSKYVTKSKDVIIYGNWELTLETVRLLDAVLKKRRLVAWGGAMKTAKKELGILDEEQADLVHIDDTPVSKDAPQQWVHWFSNYNQYGWVGKEKSSC